jgi:hypothetical protein
MVAIAIRGIIRDAAVRGTSVTKPDAHTNSINEELKLISVTSISNSPAADIAPEFIKIHRRDLEQIQRDVLSLADYDLGRLPDGELESTKGMVRSAAKLLTEACNFGVEDGTAHDPAKQKELASSIADFRGRTFNIIGKLKAYLGGNTTDDIAEKQRGLTVALKTGEEVVEALKAHRNSAMVLLSDVEAAKKSSEFSQLASAHKKAEWVWLAAFAITLLGTAGAVWWIVTSDAPIDHTIGALSWIARRLLLLSAVGVTMKIALSRYQEEKHLRIIYEHRSAAIKECRALIDTVGNDQAAQNALRLEISRLVLSDPHTGLISQRNADLQINPAISIVEKVTKAAG